MTDFWRAYALVLPPGDERPQHVPGGKEAGRTNHVERFNDTLRQRLARLVRKALSFSKCGRMRKVCLLLFISGYNKGIKDIKGRLDRAGSNST